MSPRLDRTAPCSPVPPETAVPCKRLHKERQWRHAANVWLNAKEQNPTACGLPGVNYMLPSTTITSPHSSSVIAAYSLLALGDLTTSSPCSALRGHLRVPPPSLAASVLCWPPLSQRLLASLRQPPRCGYGLGEDGAAFWPAPSRRPRRDRVAGALDDVSALSTASFDGCALVIDTAEA